MPLQVSQKLKLIELMKTPNGMDLPETDDEDIYHPPAKKKAKKNTKQKR